MDITPSPATCVACRIVLGGDTPNLVIPAMRNWENYERLHRVHADLIDGKRPMPPLPLTPPAGTLGKPTQTPAG